MDEVQWTKSSGQSQSPVDLTRLSKSSGFDASDQSPVDLTRRSPVKCSHMLERSLQVRRMMATQRRLKRCCLRQARRSSSTTRTREGTRPSTARPSGLGNEAIAKLLITGRCQVDVQDENGCTPLYFAAEQGHETVTKQLIAARCNFDCPNKRGCGPLHIAADKGHALGHVEVTKQLIASGCNVDLQMKVDLGHAAVTKLLLAARCNVE